MHYLVLATESNETETWVVQRTFTSDFELTKEELEDFMANLPEKPPFIREISTGLYETA